MIAAVPAFPTGGRRLRRRLTAAIARAATVPGADRYRTHFPASRRPPISGCSSCMG